MPNWCSNTVRITGQLKDLIEIKKLLRDGDCAFSYNKIAPLDVDTVDRARELWGTKWDNDDSVYIMSDIRIPNNTVTYMSGMSREPTVNLEEQEVLMYRFDSPWCPPDKAVEALSTQYPNVHLELYGEEGGCEIHLVEEYFNGEQVRFLKLAPLEIDEDTGETTNEEEAAEEIRGLEGYYDYDVLADNLMKFNLHIRRD